MRYFIFVICVTLAGCAVDFPDKGMYDCLKTGYSRGPSIEWHCRDGYYWMIGD